MWVGNSCIRPVPDYARVTDRMLEEVRGTLLSDPEQAETELDGAFAEFERRQPALADYVSEVLARPLGDACLALGYFLSLAVWLAFREGHGRAVKAVSADELRGTIELLQLDEDLRRADATSALDTDDVVAMQQPDLVRFLHEHMAATLDVDGEHVEPDELETVYRTMLVEVLALSYAVSAPLGFPASKSGVLA
jgi:hypothetical protein